MRRVLGYRGEVAVWTVAEEDEAGLLTVRVTDRLDEGDLTRTKLALKQQMARLRVRRGRAHILFDLSDYAGSSDDIISQFKHVDGAFVQDPGDRVALVLRRSLDKANARPLLEWPDQSSLFLSTNAARTWLASQ